MTTTLASLTFQRAQWRLPRAAAMRCRAVTLPVALARSAGHSSARMRQSPPSHTRRGALNFGPDEGRASPPRHDRSRQPTQPYANPVPMIPTIPCAQPGYVPTHVRASRFTSLGCRVCISGPLPKTTRTNPHCTNPLHLAVEGDECARAKPPAVAAASHGIESDVCAGKTYHIIA